MRYEFTLMGIPDRKNRRSSETLMREYAKAVVAVSRKYPGGSINGRRRREAAKDPLVKRMDKAGTALRHRTDMLEAKLCRNCKNPIIHADVEGK